MRLKNLFKLLNLLNVLKMPELPVYLGRARRAGFSLVLVLLIAIIGSTIMGSVIYMIGGFAGGSRATMRSEEIYVQMQDEIERAKAALKLAMNTATAPMKMQPTGSITSLDDLIIHEGGGSGAEFAPANVNKPVSYGGKSGTLRVRIFDMQYSTTGITDANLIASLPPCMASVTLTGGGGGGGMDAGVSGPGGGGPGVVSGGSSGSAGVYLIRATLELSDGTRETIETSVIQSIG